jgi:hypothetical protein
MYRRKLMTRKIICLVLIFGMSISLGGCNFTTTEGDKVQSLMLEIGLEKTRYQFGDTIPVSVKLINAGDSDIVINKRMAVNVSGAPKSLREITFNVTGPSGEYIPFTTKINVRRTTAEDLIILSPGETIEKVYNINKLYDIKNVGVYSISAVYQNSIGTDQSDLTWKDKVISNTTTFEIIP